MLRCALPLLLLAYLATSARGDDAPSETEKLATRARAIADRTLVSIGQDYYFKNADGATLAWGESYYLMSIVSLAESTREARYHDLASVHARRVFALRADGKTQKDVIRGKPIKGWLTGRYSGGKLTAHVVHTGMITYPIARWCYLVRRDAKLMRTYGKQVDALLPQLLESVAAFDAEFRESKTEDRGYYVPPTKTPYASLPYNHATAMGRAYVMLWLITGKASLRRRAVLIANEFRAGLRSVEDRYDWPYASYWPKQSEDISHAAINVDFAFQCYRAGIVFDRAAMLRFCSTLRHIHAGASGYYNLVNGTGGPTTKYTAAGGRWLRLGYLDKRARNGYAKYLFAQESKLGAVSTLLGAAYLFETAKPLALEKPLRRP